MVKKRKKFTDKRKAPYAFISLVIKRSMDTANIIRNLEHAEPSTTCEVNANWASRAAKIHSMESFPCPG